MKSVVKTSTNVAGCVSIVAALLTLVAKHFNLPVSEDFVIQVLGMLGLGTAGVVGASFMAGSTKMPSVGAIQTKTIESFNHLQSVLPCTADMKSALDVVWRNVSAHLKDTPKQTASTWPSVGSFVQMEVEKHMPAILEQIAKKAHEQQASAANMASATEQK